MPLFFGKWKILDMARVDCLTMFGAMNEDADAQDRGPNVTMHFRGSNMGNATGFFVAEAPLITDLYNFVFNWSEGACDCEITPICDDDTAREIILKKEPDWKTDYYVQMPEPNEGESMWVAEYQFCPGCKIEGHQALANLTKEADTADSGDCTPFGRWHDLGRGSGVVVASAKCEKDLYKWAYNWAPLCDVKFTPVTTDKQSRAIISGKDGFEAKLEATMKKMGKA